MKRAVLSLMLSFAVAGSLYAAQGNPSAPPSQEPSAPPSAPPSAAQPSQDRSSSDTTLIGCLVQGSSPNTWVLENAKESTDPATAKGKSYVIQVTGAADLKPHVNHQVRIVGSEAASAPGAAPAAGAEKDFPRFSARTVTMVANTCPA